METDFAAVISENDRDRVLNELSSLSTNLASNNGEGQQISFSVMRAQEGKLFLRPATPVPIVRLDDELELLFTLKDGRYLLKTKAEQIQKGEVMVSIGEGLYRLQRRKNFRAPIPLPTDRVKLFQLGHKTLVVPQLELECVNLSVGGARFVWSSTLPDPMIGDLIKIVVAIKSVHNIEVSAQIRNMSTEGPIKTVGIEFQNLSVREEQAILLLCMQLQRDSRKVLE
jgi:c-di-GMP-binding flagellar brake protein YcgR